MALPAAVMGALATPGLGWLAVAAVAAGVVRGFSGFGSALIFMPVSGIFLPPVWGVIIMLTIEATGTLPHLRRAVSVVDRREVGWLSLGFLLALPVGVWILFTVPVDGFRWAVSAVALILLALLISGWRYLGPRGPAVTTGAGLVAGVVGGATGLTGSPAILYYMASPLPSHVVRANMMVYLYVTVVALWAVFAVTGRIELQAILIGLLLSPVFLIANMAGAGMFVPGREKVYRWVAYSVIATSAILGLPVWG